MNIFLNLSKVHLILSILLYTHIVISISSENFVLPSPNIWTVNAGCSELISSLI